MRLTRRLVDASPFGRLVSTHALSTGADAFFAVSLAGSLFFNVSIGAARPRVVAYLAITLAPFVLLAPLMGPLVDRFGQARSYVLATTCLGRGILCLFADRDLNNVLLYPEAFGILVLGKTYSVTKSALVPTLVGGRDDLVAANSRLARTATVAGLVGGAAAVGTLHVSDAVQVLRIASLVYFAASALALRLPTLPPAGQAVGAVVEHREQRSRRLGFAAVAMMTLRGAIGFLSFLVAFDLKRAGAATWVFGLIAACGILGAFAGTVVSPALARRLRRHDQLLQVALLTAAVASLLASAYVTSVATAAGVVFIAAAASVGRQGFDSVLQADTPDAARVRAFARFETLFQLLWALGALASVLMQPSARSGFALLAALFTVMLAASYFGLRGERLPPTAGASN